MDRQKLVETVLYSVLIFKFVQHVEERYRQGERQAVELENEFFRSEDGEAASLFSAS